MTTTQSLRELFQLVVNGDISSDEGFEQYQGNQDEVEVTPSSENLTDEPVNVERELEKEIKFQLADLIRVNPDKLAMDEELSAYGTDSIVLKQFADQLGQQFSIEIPLALFFQEGTLENLMKDLLENFPTEIPKALNEKRGKKVSKSIPKNKKEKKKRKKNSTATTTAKKVGKVAIIGMGGRFPGADNPDEFWENLVEGKNSITEIPTSRWNWKKERENQPNFAEGCEWGGFLNRVDHFDARFFKISPLEAEMMDPQQRLLLETVRETLENSGTPASTLSGKSVGVFIGAVGNDYLQLLQEREVSNPFMGLGNQTAILANRVSFFYNFQGPCKVINANCASSTIAIHQAVSSIKAGESEMAIAGGVNLILSPRNMQSAGESGMLCPDGKPKTFDHRANGFVRGEGVGTLLLKPLDRAIEERDPIHGVILGSAINHNGRSNSLTAPNYKAISRLLETAWQSADIDPATISYIEAHGTGTELGDSVEVEGFKHAFGKQESQSFRCGIGSIKPNIGNLEGSSGIASIFKVLLAMKHQTLPPVINFEKPSPSMKLENSPLYVVNQQQRWTANDGDHPVRAGINTFGIGGSNAHLILEHFPVRTKSSKSTKPGLFILSATTEKQLRDYAERMLGFIKKEKKKISFSDLLFTLQTGRETLKERLAIIATDIESLEKHLTALLNGEENLGVYQNIESEVPTVDLDSPIHERTEAELSELAQYWVSGGKVDWQTINPVREDETTRIALPTWPLNSQPFWFDKEEKSSKGNIAKIHPMVHRNSSTLEAFSFTSLFTGKEFYLADHVIKGEKILPGVAQLEMMRTAASLISGQKGKQVKNVTWISPIIVGDQPKEVEIVLQPKKGTIRTQLRSWTGETPTLHAQGDVSFDRQVDTSEWTNLQEVRQRCDQKVSRDKSYQRFDFFKIVYGESFKGLQQVLFNQNEALAQLKLPESVVTESDEFELHPSLMDSALQTTLTLLDKPGLTAPYLPFSLGKLSLFRPLEKECYAHVTVQDVTTGDSQGDIKKFHVRILNQQGELLVEIHDFMARAYEGNRTATPLLYFKEQWQDANREESQPVEVDTVLLFDNEWNLYQSLQTKLPEETRLIRVLSGNEFRTINEQTVEIRPDQPEDYKKLLEALSTDRIAVFHCWAKGSFSTADESIRKQLEYSIESLVLLNRTFMEMDGHTPLRGLFVHTGNDNAMHPLYQGITGFAKSLYPENPGYHWKTVQIDEPVEGLTAELLRELPVEGDGFEVRYQNGKRQIKRVEPIDLPTLKDKETIRLKDRGVYLITGGAGGLGAIVTEELARANGTVRLVLAGRSELSAEKKSWLENLRKQYGATILYLQADVTKRDETNRLMEQIRDRFSGLNGIIHSAGVLNDAYVLNQTQQKVRETLAPKIFSTIYLDELSQQEKLDFFLLFSSISSVAGNPGQSVYSFGNRFMDHFAIYRERLRSREERFGQSYSINWPYWKEGGMRIDESAIKMMTRQAGTIPLDSEQGCRAMATILSGTETVVGVAVGDRDKILDRLRFTARKRVETKVMADNKDLSQLKNELRETLCGMLKLKPEDVDFSDEFEDLGFDSINYTLFSNTLNEKYGLDVSPASFFEYRTLNNFFSFLIQEFPKLTNGISEQTGVTASVASTTNGNVPETLVDDLTDLIAELLKFNREAIDPDSDLKEFGFDSISFTLFSNRINETWDLDVTPAIFFEFNSIRALAAHLKEEYQTSFTANTTVSSVQPESEETEVSMADNKLYSEDFGFAEIPDTKPEVNPKKSENREGQIAIIGMNGLFPQSEDLNAFWKNLEEQKDLISSVPASHGNLEASWGGFVEEFDRFDAKFFGISPPEAAAMDPQQRVFLEVVWKTLEDAGYKASDLAGSRTGVFVGISAMDYFELLHRNQLEIKAYSSTGSSHALLANRVSYMLDLNGPSEAIDTACSSSLVSLHRAVSLLRTGECTLAIAGGVHSTISSGPFIAFSKAGMLNPDGRCKTFDANAGGYVRGEGAGAVLLKDLSQAEQDGDHIYAVIRNVAVNHGGWAKSLTAPNPNVQADLLIDAYERVGIDPSQVTYIEAHGTGTTLGDPIEINALKKAFSTMYEKAGKTIRENSCAIGSVKTNIGHLEAAAGIAGVIKVILSLQNRTIPGVVHFQELNPYIRLDKSPFRIADKTTHWKSHGYEGSEELPRIAGVSSFGFGGTNAHIVLQEYPKQTVASEPETEQLFPLSAKTEERLELYAKRLATDLEQKREQITLRSVVHTFQTGREEMDARLTVVVKTPEELIQKLLAFANGDRQIENLCHGMVDTKNRKTGKTVSQTETLKEVAQAWVNGDAVDWEARTAQPKPSKLPLETYPFERTRYWLDLESVATQSVIPTETTTAYAQQRVPFRTESVITDDGCETIIFRKEIDPSEPVVKDHKVQGRYFVPGVAMLEMIRDAAKQQWNFTQLAINNIYWLSPLEFENERKEVRLHFKKEGSNLSVEVRTKGETDDTIHTRCEVVQTHFDKTEQKSTEARQSIQLNKDEIYKIQVDQGLNCGPLLQSLKKFSCDHQQALAELDGTANSIGIMDGSLQAVGIYLFHQTTENDKDGLYIPFAMSSVEFHAPLVDVAYVRMRQIAPYQFNVDILNNAGEALLRFRKFTLRKLQSTPAVQSNRSATQSFRPVWRTSNDWEKQRSFDEAHLVIGTPKDIEKLEQKTDLPKQNLYRIELGSRTEQIADRYWQIDTNDPTASDSVIGKLNGIKRISFIAEQLENRDGEPESQKIQRLNDKNLFTLFRLFKAFIKHGWTYQPVHFALFTRNVYQVSNEASIHPEAAALIGLVRSIAKEYAGWKITCLDLDEKELATENHLTIPYLNTSTDKNLAWRAGTLYEQRFEAITPTSLKNTAFRKEGVYMILGGAGGLGVLLSEYLAEQVQARLILLGRSELNEKKKAEIERIERKGAKVHYFQIDLDNEKESETVFQQAVATHGHIDGVIHSAVVLDDQSVERMDEAALSRAVNPKVNASLRLYELCRNQRLDFMLFFSSSQSISCNPGQANYSAGCTFKDAFAQYLNRSASFPVKIINWGYWGHTGVASSERIRKQLESIGVYSLKTEEGMEVVERMLQENHQQLLSINASEKILRQLGVETANQQTTVAAAVAPAPVEKSTKGAQTGNPVKETILGILSELLHKEVNIAAEKTPFQNLGVDSLLIVELAGMLNKKLNLNLQAIDLFNAASVQSLTEYILKENSHLSEAKESNTNRVETKVDPTTAIISEKKEDMESLNQTILELLSELLHKDPNDLDVNTPYQNFGVDSLMIVELAGSLSKKLSINLQAVDLFNASTVQSLSSYIMKENGRLFRNATETVKSETPKQKAESNDIADTDIAIIGMAGQFPDADNVEEFWQNLSSGKNSIQEVPDYRWSTDDIAGTEEQKKTCCWGGFLADADIFDPLFFQFLPRDAVITDPQQRLFLQESWRAFENAGYTEEDLSGLNCGVYVGCGNNDYRSLVGKVMKQLPTASFLGNSYSVLAARISYHLNLQGPALAVDTACSSSLIALNLAFEAFRSKSIDAALVGGVMVAATPDLLRLSALSGMLSPESQCKSFDNSANGFVAGEGVGAIILKPLAKALEDGDHIHGILKGCALNQDGKTNGIAAPSADSQEALERVVYDRFQIPAESISYVEAHGTGTKLGDPIEFSALTKAFRVETQRKRFCAVGSVKTNIGHLLTAAGVASVIKVLLSFRHKQIPPSLHYNQPNQFIEFENSPFYVNTELRQWETVENYPRRATVSSFGFSGTNAHVVLEEPPAETVGTRTEQTGPVLLPISAKHGDVVKQRIIDLIQWLEANPTADPGDLAYTLACKRNHFNIRTAIVAKDRQEILERLRKLNGVGHEAWQSLLETADSSLKALAERYCQGETIDWKAIYGGKHHRLLQLPLYPFIRDRFWVGVDYSNQPKKTRKENQNAPLFHTSIWEEAPTPNEPNIDLVANSRTLVFCSNEQQAALLPKDRILVFATDRFENRGENRYGINPEKAEDYQQLIQALQNGNSLPTHLLHLWSWQSETPLVSGVYSLFHWFRESARLKAKQAVRVVVGLGCNDVDPWHQIVAAYSRPIRQVAPQLNFSTVTLEENELTEKGLSLLNRELLLSESEKFAEEVQFNNEQRLQRKNRPLAISDTANDSLLKTGGVYLITGGCGALGMIFARHLAEKWKAKLILIGRSPLDQQKLEQCDQLRKLGAEVVYEQADSCDPEQMRQVIQRIKSAHGRLNGVLHAAGAVSDNTILQKDFEEFQSMLTPKVRGTTVLDEVTKGEELDFVALFSSSSSILGDFGQCDYAIGNRFLDQYAILRNQQVGRNERTGKTISINWPMWKEGGMHASSEDAEELYLKSSGFRYLGSREGLEVFETLLRTNSAQVLVSVGDPERIEQALDPQIKIAKPTLNKQQVLAPVAKVAPTVSVKKQEVNHHKRLEEELKVMLSGISGIAPDQLDVKESLGNYGFDSINLKELTEQIYDAFGIEIAPTVFFECSDLIGLIEHFIDEFPEEIANYFHEETTEEPVEQNHEPETIKPESHVAKPVEETVTVSAPESVAESRPVQKDIAIIGMDCKFPGSNSPEEFWEGLIAEKDQIREIPEARRTLWGEKQVKTKWGGFLDGIENFDANFFKFSPRETVVMDPQQRMLLENIWKTIEHAGYRVSDLTKQDVGVFIGVEADDYSRQLQDKNKANAQVTTGNHHAILANRISYQFDFRGCSQTVNTACSSSLTAVHQALRSIQNGDCAMAIAGGVSLILSPDSMIATEMMNILSPDGRCKTFDAGANGYVRGEGVATIFLKSLDRAVQDGDTVHAVIKGSYANHGGKANSLTAPNSDAQAELLKSAWKDANLPMETATYLEAHGTGTELGDPVEVNGIKKAFATKNGIPCGLGTVKSNIGHLEACSGMAGLFKVVLSMKQGVIPKNLNFQKMNPYIQLEKTPFRIVDQTQDWKRENDSNGVTIPRRAGVSSFGFGGSNVHLVLEEATKQAGSSITEEVTGPYLFALSAKTDESLAALINNLRIWLDKADWSDPDLTLGNISYTLLLGRETMEKQFAFAASTPEGMKKALADWKPEEAQTGTVNSLLDPEDTEAIIQRLIERKEFNKLARFRMGGVRFDETLLFQGKQTKRIPLPTYAFQHKSYWFESKAPKSVPKVRGLSCQKVLRRTDPAVRDHQVNGKMLFSVAGYLEMAAAVAQQKEAGEALNLSNVTWLRPLEVKETMDLFLSTEATKTEVLNFSIEGDKEGKRVAYVKGKMGTAVSMATSSERMEPETIRAQCFNHITGDSLRDNLEGSGFHYGPYFRVLKEVWGNNKEAIGYYELPKESLAEQEASPLYPAIVDAALQTLLGITSDSEDSSFMLPFAIGEVRCYKSLPSSGYTYVKQESDRLFSMMILDDSGTIHGEIKNMEFRIVEDSMKEFFYIPWWKPARLNVDEISRQPKQNDDLETMLIVHGGTASDLREELKKAHKTANLVEWNMEQDKELPLELQNSEQPALVYFLPALEEERMELNDLDSLDQYQSKGALNLFRMFHAFNNQGWTRKALTLAVLTAQVYEVLPGENNRPEAATLKGVLSSMAKECPNWQVKSIDLGEEAFTGDRRTLSKLARMIQQEPPMVGENEVAFRENARYVRYLKSVALNPSDTTTIRDQGVYLIFGGTGGIGMEIGKNLAATRKAKLVLVGRSELDQKREEQLKELENLGAETHYVQANIADPDQVRRACDETVTRFGALHGVMVSVVSLNSGIMESLSEQEWKGALESKVWGSMAIHKALESYSPDFLLFFSSAQAFGGSVGSSNYAAGCAFADAYAYRLDQILPYPVKTINWGYWAGIGVGGDKKFHKQVMAQGIIPIEVNDGVQAIFRVLESPFRQVVAIKGQPHLMEKLGAELSQQFKKASQKLPESLTAILNTGDYPTLSDTKVREFEDSHLTLRRFAHLLLPSALEKLGLFSSGEVMNPEALKEKLSIIPMYDRLFDELFEILLSAGLVERVGDLFIPTDRLSEPGAILNADQLKQEKERLCQEYEGITAYIELLWICCEQLPEILTGAIPATDIIFPNSSMRLVEAIYKGNEAADFYNELVAWSLLSYVKQRVPKLKPNEKIRILEIGAGTGGTSAPVFKQIQRYGEHLEYVYTDLSLKFMQFGREEYGKENPYVNFKILDIDQDVTTQGFQHGSFDIVLGTNVLHATRDLWRTLSHAKSLLKENGWMVINEATQKLDYITLIFGLLEGWWLFEDPESRITGSPLLSGQLWQRLLRQLGYKTTAQLGHATGESQENRQNVIFGESDGLFLATKAKKDEPRKVVKERRTEPVRNAETAKQRVPQPVAAKPVPVEDSIRETLKEVLETEHDNFPFDTPFSEYGVDSILSIEIVNKLNAKLDIELQSTDLFNYASIEQLTEYMQGRPDFSAKLAVALTPAEPVVIEESIEQPKASYNRNPETEVKLESRIMEIFAETLEVPVAEIDPDAPFVEFGVDSILAIEIIEKINGKLQLELRSTDLFNYSNIRTLTDKIAEQYRPEPEYEEPRQETKQLDEASIVELLRQLEQGEIPITEVEQQLSGEWI